MSSPRPCNSCNQTNPGVPRVASRRGLNAVRGIRDAAGPSGGVWSADGNQNLTTINESVTDPIAAPTRPHGNSASPPRDVAARLGDLVLNGETLLVYHPPPMQLACPVARCRVRYRSQTWIATLQSVIRHLSRDHDIRCEKRHMCKYCLQHIGIRPSTHVCMDAPENPPSPERISGLECLECGEQFPSHLGLRNHMKAHRNRRLRAERTVPLPAPRTRQTMRRRRGIQENDRDSSDPQDPTGDLEQAGSPRASQTGRMSVHLRPHDGNQDDAALENNAEHSREQTGQGNDSSRQTSADDTENMGPLGEYVPRLKLLMRRTVSNATWDDFIILLRSIMESVAKVVKLRPVKEPHRQRPQPDLTDAATVQRMYRSNRRRTMRLLTGNKSSRCEVDTARVEEHFNEVFSERAHDPHLYEAAMTNRPAMNLDPFEPSEVRLRLRRCENTSPGPDRVTYSMWRTADPDCHVLAGVFNLCVKHRRIPQAWKTTKTVLIPKKGDPQIMTNWRPIALANTIYKLYTGCLSTRLSSWIADNKVLHPAQKGFLPFDGVFEHNYVLRNAIDRARKGQRRLCVAWLDISNAFGSVPHGAIAQALRCAGVGTAMAKIVRDIISDNITEVMTSNGPTQPIRVRAGVKQGCPLSGLLFNITIDPIIRQLQQQHNEHRVLAYADDLAIIAEDQDDLQEQLLKVERLCERLALRLNAEKSRTLHVRTVPTLGVQPTIFRVAGQEIPRFQDITDIEIFLGTPIGFSVIPSNATLLQITNLGLKVLRSKLAPWQRLDAIRTFVAPSAHFHMRNGVFRKTDWEEVDKVIKQEIKRTLSVPQEATNNYIYGPLDAGLCGVPCLAETSDISLIDSAFKLLRSRDPMISEMATSNLEAVVRRRTKIQANDDLLGRYMSGDNGQPLDAPSNEPRSTWSMARSASRRLKVEWEFEGRDPSLRIGESIIEPRHRTRVMRLIRDECGKRRLRDLVAKPSQGKAIECVAADKSNSHFIRDGAFTRFADWRFIHRARLSLVPLNGYVRGRPVDPLCRRCHGRVETLPHVMCHCMHNSTAYKCRHDAIVTRITQVASDKGYSILSRNQLVPGTTLKPDLVITKGNSLHIIDVTVPFENRLTSFRDARQAKVVKYEPLIERFREQYDEVSIEPVVVGALGSWDSANDNFVLRLCSRNYLRLMKKLIISETIKWSRDVYTEHITGRRQYVLPQDPLAAEGNVDAGQESLQDITQQQSEEADEENVNTVPPNTANAGVHNEPSSSNTNGEVQTEEGEDAEEGEGYHNQIFQQMVAHVQNSSSTESVYEPAQSSVQWVNNSPTESASVLEYSTMTAQRLTHNPHNHRNSHRLRSGKRYV